MEVTIPCCCAPRVDGQQPHPTGDHLTFHEPLDPRVRRSLIYDMTLLGEDSTDGERFAILSEGYMLRCIDAWTLVDAKDKPLPPSRDNIRALLLPNALAYDIAAKATDELYSGVVLGPLAMRALSFSPPRQTGASTSATNGSTSRTKRSKPSSTSTTQTDATEPTPPSLAGASST